MRIVITGSQGFLGNNFAMYLKSTRGEAPLGLDIHPDADVSVDISDLNSLTSTLKPDDLIYHFAAVADSSQNAIDPYMVNKINIFGTLNVLEAALRVGASKVVLISSSWVYSAMVNPELQDKGDFSHRGSPHFYTTSKVCSELLTQGYGYQDINITIVRPFNPYGPNMWKGLVIREMLTRASQGQNVLVYGDGSNRRSFIHTDDICHALEFVMDDKTNGKIYNLCGLESTSILDLAQMISSRFGVGIDFKESKVRKNEYYQRESFTPRSNWDEFDWQPHMIIQDGLDMLIKNKSW